MSQLVDGLNSQQVLAVTHAGGPCLVLAGAGSGKTRVITRRIAWLVDERAEDPAGICAVTFTNRAAAEMRARVRALLGREPEGLWLLTFHAMGLRLLRQVAGQPGAPRPGFAVSDRADSLGTWRQAQAEAGVDAHELSPNALYEACSRARNRLEDPRAWDREGRPWDQRAAGRVFSLYRDAMQGRGVLDFDDLLEWPLRLLACNPDLTAPWQSRFRHLLVDEYQDTNRLQYRLVRSLLGPESSLMVVGDEDQSIYRWRGAELANVLDFQADFPGATVVRLEQNYRSTQPILRAAGSLVAHNRERLGKALWTEEPGGEKPQFMLCAGERQEAVWVAKQIACALAEGTAASEVAVLYRTNAQSRAFEEEFAGRRIPFRVLGGPTFFRRTEVKDLLSWARLLIADDDTAFVRAAARPVRGVGPVTVSSLSQRAGSAAAALRQAMASSDPEAALRGFGCLSRALPGLLSMGRLTAELRAALGEVELGALIERILHVSGYADFLRAQQDGEERLGNVDELIASATEFGGSALATERSVAAFIDRAALVSDTDLARGSGGGVSLMTIHAAKGLEFHTVFVAGLEEGLFPHASSVQEGQVEEERRLCYVAMTRARRRLLLSAARLRRVRGQERLQQTSRFVGEIDPVALDLHEDPVTTVARAAQGSRRSSRRDHPRPSPAPSGARRATRPVNPHARGTGVPAPLAALQPGTAIFHPKFGPGRIFETQGAGDRLKLSVSFTGAGTKQLIARFAKLQLLT